MNQNQLKCTQCSLAPRCIWGDHPPAQTAIRLPKVYQPHANIFSAGDECAGLYIVRSGLIKAYAITDDGDEHILGFHYPGSIVGLEGFRLGQHETYADSVDTSAVCIVPRSALLDTVTKDPHTALALLSTAGSSVMQGVHAQLSLGTMSAERKIANFLLDTSAEFARQGYSDTRLRLPMQRTEVARYLSLAIETVSRVFRKLEDRGIVAVDPGDRHQVTIVSISALRELARPTDELAAAA